MNVNICWHLFTKSFFGQILMLGLSSTLMALAKFIFLLVGHCSPLDWFTNKSKFKEKFTSQWPEQSQHEGSKPLPKHPPGIKSFWSKKGNLHNFDILWVKSVWAGMRSLYSGDRVVDRGSIHNCCRAEEFKKKNCNKSRKNAKYSTDSKTL